MSTAAFTEDLVAKSYDRTLLRRYVAHLATRRYARRSGSGTCARS